MTFALLSAVAAGLLIAAQAAIIGEFGERIHPFVAAVWVHVGGLAFGIAGVLLLPGLAFEFDAVRQAPWGMLAGVAGMLLVTSIAVAIPGIGLGVTLAVVTGVQLIGAFLIEASGVVGDPVPLDIRRILGTLLIVVGVLLIFGRGETAMG